MSVNRIVIMGRLCAAPDLKSTSNGNSVTSFTVAVDRAYRNEDGDYDADFLQVVAWRGTAEFVSRYFDKGDMIAVDGRLQSRKYTTKDGEKRTTYEIVADNVSFGGAKRDKSRDDDYAYVPPPGSKYSASRYAPSTPSAAPPDPNWPPREEPQPAPPAPSADPEQIRMNEPPPAQILPSISDFDELDDIDHTPF